MITVNVDGRPAPKGSRNVGRTKTGKTYTYPGSRYEAPWTDAVKKATQTVMRHHDQPDPPYEIRLEFRLEHPTKNRREMPWWSTKHDLDKLARAVIDGLVKGGAMSDDRHVIALTATKRYVQAGEAEGVNAQIQGVLVEAAL